LNNQFISLVINNAYNQLPEENNDYFTLEGKEGLNTGEGITRLPFRRFVSLHPQSENFVQTLGDANTFIFHRLLLSYYDAAVMLKDFTRKYNVFTTITLMNIEELALDYDIGKFNYHSLDYATYLAEVDMSTDTHKKEYHNLPNDVQELFWSMNLEKILNNYGISYYPDRTFKDEEKIISNTNLLIYKMLKIREVSMVMHTWRKLNSYNKADFIGNVSNLLEFIVKDFRVNSATFDTSKTEYQLLSQLLNMVHNSKRPVYFGLFNSAPLLGFASRHGAELLEYNTLSTNSNMDIQLIRDNMINKIIPNQNEIRYLYNVWHLTASLAVTLWFRLKKYNS